MLRKRKSGCLRSVAYRRSQRIGAQITHDMSNETTTTTAKVRADSPALNGYAAFEPRKSWVLVGPNNRVIHLADNRNMLDALLRKGDRIARAVISPLTEEPRTSPLETEGGCRINEEGTLHGQRHTRCAMRRG